MQKTLQFSVRLYEINELALCSPELPLETAEAVQSGTWANTMHYTSLQLQSPAVPIEP